MGTNYYHQKTLNGARCLKCGGALCCDSCDGPRLHIGKSSVGWTFSFQGYQDTEPPIRSYQDWLARLGTDGEISNEYGDKVDLEEFKRLVQAKQAEPRNYNHAARYSEDRRNFLDPEGYSFSDGEFS